jgi:hypothetical protein
MVYTKMVFTKETLDSIATLMDTFLPKVLGGNWTRETSPEAEPGWISVIDGNFYQLCIGTFWAKTSYKGQDGAITTIKIPLNACKIPQCPSRANPCISSTIEDLIMKSPEFSELALNELSSRRKKRKGRLLSDVSSRGADVS